jgi:hypothetical protein
MKLTRSLTNTTVAEGVSASSHRSLGRSTIQRYRLIELNGGNAFEGKAVGHPRPHSDQGKGSFGEEA